MQRQLIQDLERYLQSLEAYKSGALSGRGHDCFTYGLASEIRTNALKVDKSKR
ncbi:hypothetical protein [Klebsiella michiganensis]|uniref:hypothetical protein n=1 Tax=Klebsiella michiganensis TaxID=1134687 RepID=UPI001BD513F6|nr:hypothetical protein [Klebsiella michiganensis]